MKDNNRGLFDLIFHFESLPLNGDPLVKLNEIINWEQFRPYFKVIRKQNASGKGRPPFDEILMFKIVILQSLHNVSDDKMEFLIRDRLSFMRFLGFQSEKAVFPDAKTIWLFKEALNSHKIIEKLFERFNRTLAQNGFRLNSGNIIDASIIQVPKQRNTQEENSGIKEGEPPKEWLDNPNKLSQKDLEAQWVQKKGVNFYGYKDNVIVDKKTKLIKAFEVTPANVYDGVAGKPLLGKLKRGEEIYGDSAYSNTKEFTKEVRRKKLKAFLCSKGYRNKPLTKKNRFSNSKISRTRCRVEHVFGDIKSFSLLSIRSIGLARANFQIGVMNLVYNMRRYVFLVTSS